MAVALISAATGRPVDRRWAMTGEVTLRGYVLPVGGIKEKVLAARRAELTGVVLPGRNERDLDDVPQDVRETLRIETADDVDHVLSIVLRASFVDGSLPQWEPREPRSAPGREREAPAAEPVEVSGSER
jgi:ATP-dependent Lon protease